jgi:hypothetical protein
MAFNCNHRKDAKDAEELFFHLTLSGRQMKICNHFVVGFAYLSYCYDPQLTKFSAFLAVGLFFSLSAFPIRQSAGRISRKRKEDQLCVLGDSSAAGGENI